MLADCKERLKSLIRYCSPSGPKYFRWSFVRLSEPAGVELLESLMGFMTWFAVKKQMLWSRG